MMSITKPKVSRLNLKIEGLGHQIRTSSNRWNICLICGQSWHDNGRHKLIGRGKCPGDKLWSQNQEQQPWKLIPNIGFMFLNTVVHHTHRLSWHRGVIYCDLCGSTAIKGSGRISETNVYWGQLTIGSTSWNIFMMGNHHHPTRCGHNHNAKSLDV